ncbi:hypothetical protein ACRALDRAFT_2020456 [Sodiomyces alcalophilus JCM 7366]|uniref:uncharacterized protein n=1 Tax=Sodiomyces alcalophilus JCM 7366 TaxID=591952 RepID=UPI0039B42D46
MQCVTDEDYPVQPAATRQVELAADRRSFVLAGAPSRPEMRIPAYQSIPDTVQRTNGNGWIQNLAIFDSAVQAIVVITPPILSLLQGEANNQALDSFAPRSPTLLEDMGIFPAIFIITFLSLFVLPTSMGSRPAPQRQSTIMRDIPFPTNLSIITDESFQKQEACASTDRIYMMRLENPKKDAKRGVSKKGETENGRK